ncbi:MAG TPA: ABC transporter permease [Saprospiraceae bacterium]|nr:ABC transporter [Saprospirales bacterium]HRQ28695.1 ABC transporter permease [Saprospiraceae bacterium]
MNLLENIKIAIRSVRSNILRSLLTIMIITVGITSLVGILTAIDTIIISLNDNFSAVGGNTFSITPKFDEIKSQRHGRMERAGDPISFRNAMEFQERYNFPGSMVTVHTDCTSSATVKYKDEKTNPTINVRGVDLDFFEISGFEIIEGRNFNRTENANGTHMAIIGSELVNLLFDKNPDKAINKIIDIDGNNYKVIGTLKSKGSGGNTQNDRNVFIPLLNAKQYYHYADKEYNLDIGILDALRLEDAQSQAIGVFRNVRKLKAFEDNDFEIRKSDSLLNMIKDATLKIRIATVAIALITLLGAAIGLMNIMLVSVTERTQEVGVRKALGATRNNILVQFLTEAVVIGQIGGILGIIFGIVIGLVLAIYIDSRFVIPWAWIILGFMVNMVVGIFSGLYPALKAAKLDPIESLRHE